MDTSGGDSLLQHYCRSSLLLPYNLLAYCQLTAVQPGLLADPPTTSSMYPPPFPNIHHWWYPIGNTPAVDLLRETRHDDPRTVNILALACGDPRSILYTLWCEKGFGKLDIDSWV